MKVYCTKNYIFGSSYYFEAGKKYEAHISNKKRRSFNKMMQEVDTVINVYIPIKKNTRLYVDISLSDFYEHFEFSNKFTRFMRSIYDKIISATLIDYMRYKKDNEILIESKKKYVLYRVDIREKKIKRLGTYLKEKYILEKE